MLCGVAGVCWLSVEAGSVRRESRKGREGGGCEAGGARIDSSCFESWWWWWWCCAPPLPPPALDVPLALVVGKLRWPTEAGEDECGWDS